MSVRRRMWRNPESGALQEKWMVDVKFEHPDGRVERIRKVSPVQTRRGAEQYERDVRQALLAGSYGRKEEQEVPTLSVFAETFVSSYATANNKPSEVWTKKRILEQHLLPAFGTMRLDAIGAERIESYKAQKLREGLHPKTVQNHLACLSKILRTACEWGRIAMSPRIKPLKVPKPKFDFFDFDEAERLVEAATGQLRAMIHRRSEHRPTHRRAAGAAMGGHRSGRGSHPRPSQRLARRHHGHTEGRA